MKRTVLKLISVLLTAVMLVSAAPLNSFSEYGLIDWENAFTLSASAVENGTFGDYIKWMLDDEGTLTISGKNDMPDSSTIKKAPWHDSCDLIKKVVINEGIEAIGKFAFNGCENMEAVYIPASVGKIKSSAFAGCDALETVYYYATEEAWDNIEISIIGNSDIKNAEKHCAYASNGSGNNMWAYFSDGTLEISGNGQVGPFGFGNAPWSYFSDSITRLVINSGISAIGDNAFYGLTKLSSVVFPEKSFVFPEGLQTIGKAAFYGCSSLSTVSFPEGLEKIDTGAFFNCTSLTDISFPKGLRIIEGEAFQKCSALTSVIFPDELKTIGVYAFLGCTSLERVVFPEGLQTIGRDAFNGCTSLSEVALPETLTQISEGTFEKCTSLTSVEIPESVKAIGARAFNGCEALSDVYYIGSEENFNKITIGSDNEALSNAQLHCIRAKGSCGENLIWMINDAEDTLTISGSGNMTNWVLFPYAPWHNFSGSIKTVIIEDGVQNISVNAFAICNELEAVYIPSSVTEIDNSAFMDCEKLSDVYFYGTKSQWNEIVTSLTCEPLLKAKVYYVAAKGSCGENLTWMLDDEGTLTISGSGAMAEWTTATEVPWHYKREQIKKVVISDTVTSIGSFAFHLYNNLTEVQLPQNLTGIGEYSFSYCDKLQKISFPECLEKIGDGAFMGCDALTKISLPEKLIEIECKVFSGCSQLSEIKFSEGLKVIGEASFSDCTALISVKFPDGLEIIGESAFSGCTELKEIKLPESLKNICTGAFSVCTSLESLYIPDNANIYDMAFVACDKLKEINVSENNRFYLSENGVLYNKDKTILFCYPSGKTEASFVIPDGVTTLGYGAFYNNLYLSEVTLPKGLIVIKDFAFVGCPLLTSLYMPSSVEYIGESMFEGSEALSDIYYSGSEEQWKEIKIGEYNESLENAEIHYNFCAHKNKIHHEKEDANCTEKGSIEYWSCPDCEKNFSDKECTTVVTDTSTEINEGNHTDTTAFDVTKETCLEAGYTAGTYCNDCEKWIEGHEKIEAIGHKNKEHHEKVDATCIKEGLIEYWSCPDCEKIFSDKECTTVVTDPSTEINKNNHKNTKTVNAVESTYVSVGFTAGVYCNDCKKYISGHDEIPVKKAEFINSDKAQLEGNNAFVTAGVVLQELLSQAGEGAFITKSDGTKLSASEPIGTRMTLVMPDGKNYSVIVLGDIDGDGKITAKDARIALRTSVELETIEADSPKFIAADVEKNGKITAKDARRILRASVELENPADWLKK